MDTASMPERTETSVVPTEEDGWWTASLSTLWCPDLEQDVGWCSLSRLDGSALEGHEQLQRVAEQVLECEPLEVVVPVVPNDVRPGDGGMVAGLLVLPDRAVSGYGSEPPPIAFGVEDDRAVLRLGSLPGTGG